MQNAAIIEAATLKAVAVVDADAYAAKRENKINMLWEYTQATLALVMTLAYIYGTLAGILVKELAPFVGVVLGFYFGRTNHARPTPTNSSGS